MNQDIRMKIWEKIRNPAGEAKGNGSYVTKRVSNLASFPLLVVENREMNASIESRSRLKKISIFALSFPSKYS